MFLDSLATNWPQLPCVPVILLSHFHPFLISQCLYLYVKWSTRAVLKHGSQLKALVWDSQYCLVRGSYPNNSTLLPGSRGRRLLFVVLVSIELHTFPQAGITQCSTVIPFPLWGEILPWEYRERIRANSPPACMVSRFPWMMPCLFNEKQTPVKS